MAVRPILVLGNPVLRNKARKISRFDQSLERLVQDMIETMREAPGVGLAAPQIGEPVRVAVVDVSGHRACTAGNGLLTLVDPRLVEGAGREVGREGCQSIPWYIVDVRRFRRIVVETERGRCAWSIGIEARAVQHELDHLDGVLILDRAAGARAIHHREAPER